MTSDRRVLRRSVQCSGASKGKRVLRRVLRRGSYKDGGGFQRVPGTPSWKVRPLRRAPQDSKTCRSSLARKWPPKVLKNGSSSTDS